jgi:hypothetical protein
MFALAALAPASLAFAQGDGYSGDNGYGGQDGQSGSDVTIFATGGSYDYNLSGTDGTPGGNGSPGGDGACFSYTMGIGNIQEPCGGNGGSGGDGGSGGNGGDITVYYKDIANVAKIHVISNPGSGASGGWGGNGGAGCDCGTRSWSVQRCRDVANPAPQQGTHQECWDETYYCFDGGNGAGGSAGSSGSDGSYGEATLIPKLTQLEDVLPSIDYDLGSLSDGFSVVLSDNIWSEHTGAVALFAPGSSLSDTYRRWESRYEQTAKLSWKAARPLSEFAGSALHLQVGDPGVDFSIGSDTWTDASSSTDGSVTTIAVTQALHQSDATQIVMGTLSGEGENVVLTLNDTAGVSSLVGTAVHLELAVKHLLFFYKTLFKNDVPAQFVTSTKDQVQIALGKLPGVNPAKWFKKKHKLRIRLTTVRSFSGNSAEVDFKESKQYIP